MLVPGIDGTGLLFYRQLPLLERRYAVTTTRLRDDAARMGELVADLHDAVSAAAPDGRPVTLLGESFGGALTLSYAVAHPERVARLVILNSFAHFGSKARLLARLSPAARHAVGHDARACGSSTRAGCTHRTPAAKRSAAFLA